MCSFYARILLSSLHFSTAPGKQHTINCLTFFSQLQIARAVFSALDTVQSTERHPSMSSSAAAAHPAVFVSSRGRRTTTKTTRRKRFWEVARVVVVITFGGFFANDDHGNDTVQRPRTIAGSFSGSDERRGKQRLAQSGRFVGV